MTANIDSIGWLNSDSAPWHGLGNAFSASASREELLTQCGFRWEYQGKPVLYRNSVGDLQSVPASKVTVRSDTGAELGIVGKDFQYVQPADVLDTFLGVAEAADLQIAVAGVLAGGRRLWALAKIEDSVELPGHDRVEPFVLLATANDGSMRTRGRFTCIRVVCQNTWQAAFEKGTSREVSIRHDQVYDKGRIRDGLGIASLWTSEKENMLALSSRMITKEETFTFLTTTLGNPDLHITDDDQPHKQAMRKVWALMKTGRGAQLTSAANTAWGAFNAITEYADHHRRAVNQDNRLTSAWFGDSAQLKSRAYEAAMALVV